MASLSSLRSELSYWNNRTAECNNRIRTLKRRRSDVESVRRALKSVADGNSADINGRIRQAARKLESAIEYSGKENRLDAVFAGKNELAAGTDPNLSSADVELLRELNDIDRRIGEAGSELSGAQEKIREIKDAVKAEEIWQREEAARRAAERSADRF